MANKDGLKALVTKLNKAQGIIANYYKITRLLCIMPIKYADIELQLLTIHREDLLKEKNIDYSKMNLSEMNEAVCDSYPFHSALFKIKEAILFHQKVETEWFEAINRTIPIMKTIIKEWKSNDK